MGKKFIRIALGLVLSFSLYSIALAGPISEGGGSGGGSTGAYYPPSSYTLEIFRVCDGVPESTALSCFVGAVYKFAQTAIFLLSSAAVIGAGLVYMASGGNPKRVELAKRLLVGAASAIAIVVLARFFLTKVVGVPWPI